MGCSFKRLKRLKSIPITNAFQKTLEVSNRKQKQYMGR